MQISGSKGFEARVQYYASKAYVSQMKKGGDYEERKNLIFLSIILINIC